LPTRLTTGRYHSLEPQDIACNVTVSRITVISKKYRLVGKKDSTSGDVVRVRVHERTCGGKPQQEERLDKIQRTSVGTSAVDALLTLFQLVASTRSMRSKRALTRGNAHPHNQMSSAEPASVDLRFPVMETSSFPSLQPNHALKSGACSLSACCAMSENENRLPFSFSL